MIELRRIDREQNMARYYALSVVPTLFGEWALHAEWGRIGQAGQIQHCCYPDEATALSALGRRMQRKIDRGYRAKVRSSSSAIAFHLQDTSDCAARPPRSARIESSGD